MMIAIKIVYKIMTIHFLRTLDNIEKLLANASTNKLKTTKMKKSVE